MRKKAKKVDIIIIAVILLMIIGGIVLAVLPQKNQHQQTGNTTVAADTDGDGTVTYKDYIGKRIGIKTGSSFEAITFEYFLIANMYIWKAQAIWLSLWSRIR